MGTLTEADKHYLARNFLLGFLIVIIARLQRRTFKPNGYPRVHVSKSLKLPFAPYVNLFFAKPISEISFGKFLLQLFQTARRFEMPIQPQLVLLQKNTTEY